MSELGERSVTTRPDAKVSFVINPNQGIGNETASLREELAAIRAALERIGETAFKRSYETYGLRQKIREINITNKQQGGEKLRGKALREAAARSFFLEHGGGHSLHYLNICLLLLERQGVFIDSDEPEATFLASFTKSPVVIKSGENRSGMYSLDISVLDRLRSDLMTVSPKDYELTLRDLNEAEKVLAPIQESSN